jgi:monoamine oxidase
MATEAQDIVIIGAGAAGIAAARRLREGGRAAVVLEARDRVGGRAWTLAGSGGLDLGCGWLHSADRNPLTVIAGAEGFAIDRTPPPWARSTPQPGFPLDEQAAFRAALMEMRQRLDAFPEEGPDRAAGSFVSQGRWRPLLDAVSTYFSGTELDRVSARDFSRYDDTGVNWRVVEGYGTLIAAEARGLDVRLGCPVRRIDHRGARIRVESAKGTVEADRVVVALPASLIDGEAVAFDPPLPEKVEAAAGLPLGLADKVFLALDQAEEFDADSRLFGRTDRPGTGAYHLRPFGRPIIEGYFGGAHAAGLEAAGEGAFADFAIGELVGLFGTDFRRRVRPLAQHAWGSDPYARGSYSCALPGRADGRAALAAPVDGRLFFAGEACSRSDYSTAHGAWRTGIAAADAILAAPRGEGRR